MSSDFDPADFVDNDFQARKTAAASSPTASVRAPSREEVDSKVMEAQQRLAELKRAQEELERERASLEEIRRRRMEYQTGREEMLQHLTRGVGLLEEAAFAARRDAEQMTKTLADFHNALTKVQATNEESWTKDNFNIELTRALTVIENARMEWNTARLKLPVLSGQAAQQEPASSKTAAGFPGSGTQDFAHLCKLGLAMTWPLAAVLLLGFSVLIFVMTSQR